MELGLIQALGHCDWYTVVWEIFVQDNLVV